MSGCPLARCVGDDCAVAETDDALSTGGEPEIVGHENDRRTRLPVERLEEVDDAASTVSIEIPGRLVGEQDARGVRECPGDRDALLLTAGELAWKVVQPVGEPDAAEQLARARRGTVLAAELERHLHVLRGRERRDELKGLKHKPNFLAAKPCARVLVHGGEVGPVQDHRATRGCIESGEQTEQRCFATPGRPDDGDERALRDRKRHVAEHGKLMVAGAVFFR
jgi:hypothetical protein